MTQDTCPWCGAKDAAGTCPRSLTCPVCAAGPGSPCKRPSGHRAAQLHAPRIRLAEGGGGTPTPLARSTTMADPAGYLPLPPERTTDQP